MKDEWRWRRGRRIIHLRPKKYFHVIVLVIHECGQFKERRMSHSGADMYVNKRKNVLGVLIVPMCNGTLQHFLSWKPKITKCSN